MIDYGHAYEHMEILGVEGNPNFPYYNMRLFAKIEYPDEDPMQHPDGHWISIEDDDIRLLFLDRYGDQLMMYPANVMYSKIRTRVELTHDYWEKQLKTACYRYDPISNYDRNEVVEESNTNDSTGVNSSHDTVRGFPMNNTTGKEMTSTSGTDNINNVNRAVVNHKAHLYGNIGVTTTQQMLEEERKIIVNFIYKYIEIFKDLFYFDWYNEG